MAGAVELRDAHAAEGEPAQQLHRRDRVALVLRHDVGVGRAVCGTRGWCRGRPGSGCRAARPCSLRRVVEHRDRRGHHVRHGVAEAPPAARPGARVERLGPQVLHVAREVRQRVVVRRRVAVERRLGPERGDVLEHRHVVDVARIPRVEARAHVRRADLAVLLERLRDRHADGVHLAPHERRRVAADRLGEGRQPDARRERRRLVVHVDDLRLPLPPRALDHARLDHVEHVAVAVVVVPDVLLVELHERRDLVRRAQVRRVPVGDDVLAVGVDRRPEHHDHVVEDAPDPRVAVGAGHQVVGELDRVLRPARPRSRAGRRRCGRWPSPRRRAGGPRRRSDPSGCARRRAISR